MFKRYGWWLAGLSTAIGGYQTGVHHPGKAALTDGADRAILQPSAGAKEAAPGADRSSVFAGKIDREAIDRLMASCKGLGSYETSRLLAKEAELLDPAQITEVLGLLSAADFSDHRFAHLFSKELASFLDPRDIEAGAKILALADSKWDRQERFGRMAARLPVGNPQDLLSSLRELASPYVAKFPELATEGALNEMTATLWVDRSWSQAWKFASGDDALSTQIRNRAASVLNQTNPALAIEMLQDGTLPGLSKEKRSKQLSLSLMALGMRDPIGCYQVILKNGVDLQDKAVRGRLRLAISQADPGEFLKLAKADEGLCHLPVFGSVALRGAISSDPDFALQMFQRMTPDERKATMSDMQNLRGCEGSPQDFAKFMMQPEVTAVASKEWVSRGWGPLASRDPQAAEDALSQWHPGEEGKAVKDLAVQALAKAWATVDPARAVALADGQDDVQKAAIFQAMAGQWAQKDGPAALTWAQNLEDPRARSQAILAIFQQYPSLPPDGLATLTVALTTAAETGKPSGRDLMALDFTAGRAAQGDPAEAMTTLMDQPDSAMRSKAIDSLFSAWAKRDVAGLAQWLDQSDVVAGPRRDAAVVALIGQIAADPQVAVRWAGSIEAPQQRQEMLAKIVSDEGLDPASAADAGKLVASGDTDALVALLQTHRNSK